MCRNPEVHTSHPSFFIVPSPFKDGSGGAGGTLQSRITCKDGPHQTDPPPLQECWRSRWEGGLIVSYDLSQIELRTAALLSGEPAMVNEYLKDLTGGRPDLHRQMAVSVFGEQVLQNPHWKDGTWNDPRQWGGKTPNFLILFRGGASKYQATILADSGRILPMQLCEKVVTGAKAARPILWAWQDTLIEEARRTGRILLPIFGQSRNFGGGDKYDVNEIVNFPVQATASNTLLQIAHHVHRALRSHPLRTGILPFLNIYDAIKFDCKTPSHAEALDTLYRAAILHVETQGYWARLQDLYQRRVPIAYEREAA